jgi:hypothetical protein
MTQNKDPPAKAKKRPKKQNNPKSKITPANKARAKSHIFYNHDNAEILPNYNNRANKPIGETDRNRDRNLSLSNGR